MFTHSPASDDNNQNLRNNHVQNQSENGKYNLILVYLSIYGKNFSVCAGEHLPSVTHGIGMRRSVLNMYLPVMSATGLSSRRDGP